MKKIVIIMMIFSLISLAGCVNINSNNVSGNNNNVGNKETVNGVNVEVPIDVDVNSNDYKKDDNDETLKNTQDDKILDNENDNISESIENNESGTISPFVTSDPKSDTVINVNLVNWSDEDRDIFGNNYTGNNTMKLSVYNMIYAMGGGSDDITAEIHMPFGERFDATWIIDFVVMQDMLGNGSYANVTILSDEQELYPTFTIESDTTDKMEYEVNLSGIRDLVIRFECHAVDNGFCGGVIFTDKEE